MRPAALDALAWPSCGHAVEVGKIVRGAPERIEEGELTDSVCGHRAQIRRFIPRFAKGGPDVDSFGYQWRRFARTQLDRYNGTTLSRQRFFDGTGWAPQELAGQRILEAGCGAGRFTDILLSSGADVYAFDATEAVDVCLENVGPHPRLSLIQARLEEAPFKPGAFDRIFCYGVLQHVADPRAAFVRLVSWLRPGGALAADVYRRAFMPSRWNARHLWRPVTRRLPKPLLYKVVERYVPPWIEVENRCARIPKLRGLLASVVPCWNYTGTPGLTAAQIKEWAVLDTFDALAAWHDHPQTERAVEEWCRAAGLADARGRPGGNGIVVTARKP